MREELSWIDSRESKEASERGETRLYTLRPSMALKKRHVPFIIAGIGALVILGHFLLPLLAWIVFLITTVLMLLAVGTSLALFLGCLWVGIAKIGEKRLEKKWPWSFINETI